MKEQSNDATISDKNKKRNISSIVSFFLVRQTRISSAAKKAKDTKRILAVFISVIPITLKIIDAFSEFPSCTAVTVIL
jgi:hypothetical protein